MPMKTHEEKKLLNEQMTEELKVIYADANCTNCPSEWFFPAITKGKIPSGPGTNVYNAKQICGECKVQKECYNFAYKHHCIGVWGGVVFGSHRKPRKRVFD